MNNAVLQVCNDPRQEPVHRVSGAEVKIRQLVPKGIKVERGRDAAAYYPVSGKGQFPAQSTVPTQALVARWKQGHYGLD